MKKNDVQNSTGLFLYKAEKTVIFIYKPFFFAIFALFARGI